MTRNLKIIGVGLITALVMSALFASGASAESDKHAGGHVVNDADDGHLLLHGSFEAEHQMSLMMFGGVPIGCVGTYKGDITAATVTAIALSVEGTVCGPIEPTIRMNGCNYTLTIRQTDATTKANPVHLMCPAGVKGEIIQHEYCTIKFGTQTFTEGALYKSTTVNGKHAMTVEFDLNTVFEKHGSCLFGVPFGTGPFSSSANGIVMKGSMTLAATDTEGLPANFTATGSNGH